MSHIDSYKSWRAVWATYMVIDKLHAEGEADIITRHLERANVAYLDGSSRARTVNYLIERRPMSHTFWDVEL